jgi:uncharacterized alkaline shock family protein YloU
VQFLKNKNKICITKKTINQIVEVCIKSCENIQGATRVHILSNIITSKLYIGM